MTSSLLIRSNKRWDPGARNEEGEMEAGRERERGGGEGGTIVFVFSKGIFERFPRREREKHVRGDILDRLYSRANRPRGEKNASEAFSRTANSSQCGALFREA